MGILGGAKGVGNALSNVGSALTTATKSTMSTLNKYNNMGSAIANSVSQKAQDNQFAYNAAEAALQRDYNAQMWDQQAAFNSAEAQLTRDFNAAEAQKNRDWQERMSNTAYQRAVADLKKAGLNPILAYMNPANVGSGATASGGQASASLQSGAAASGSNYTGQGHNMSEMAALCGVLGETMGSLMSAFGMYLGSQSDEIDRKMKDWQMDFGLFSAHKGRYDAKNSYNRGDKNQGTIRTNRRTNIA